MAQRVKVLDAKSGDLSLVPSIHMVSENFSLTSPVACMYPFPIIHCNKRQGLLQRSGFLGTHLVDQVGFNILSHPLASVSWVFGLKVCINEGFYHPLIKTGSLDDLYGRVTSQGIPGICLSTYLVLVFQAWVLQFSWSPSACSQVSTAVTEPFTQPLIQYLYESSVSFSLNMIEHPKKKKKLSWVPKLVIQCSNSWERKEHSS